MKNVNHIGRGQHEKENKKHQFYNDYDLAFGSDSMWTENRRK